MQDSVESNWACIRALESFAEVEKANVWMFDEPLFEIVGSCAVVACTNENLRTQERRAASEKTGLWITELMVWWMMVLRGWKMQGK
jgi:hypothetical protein